MMTKLEKLEFDDLILYFGDREAIKEEVARLISKEESEKEFDTLFLTGREKKMLFAVQLESKLAIKTGIQRHLISNAILEAADLTEDECNEAGYQLARVLAQIDEELGL